MVLNFHSENSVNVIWQTVNETKVEEIIVLNKTLPTMTAINLANSEIERIMCTQSESFMKDKLSKQH